MDREAVSNKADRLAQKINDITKKFDIAEEITGDDVVETIDAKVEEIHEFHEMSITDVETISDLDVVNLDILVDDFKFVRDTLQEIIKNGRRVLNNITLDLLDSDDEKRASLIISFAELNNSLTNNMKVYTQSYKQISEVLVNINKLRDQNLGKGDGPKNVTNNVTINTTETISTANIIEKLKDIK